MRYLHTWLMEMYWALSRSNNYNLQSGLDA